MEEQKAFQKMKGNYEQAVNTKAVKWMAEKWCTQMLKYPVGFYHLQSLSKEIKEIKHFRKFHRSTGLTQMKLRAGHFTLQFIAATKVIYTWTD